MGNNDKKLPFTTGGGGGGGGNSSQSVFDPAPPQKSGDSGANPDTIVEGGKLPKADPGPESGDDVGYGTPGGKKPYKLNG